MARTVGSTNKNKDRLWKALKAEYGEDFDPIMKMAENCDTLQKIADAHRDGAITEDKAEAGNVELIDATSSAQAANAAWEKIAPYVEPKLTATTMDLRATEVPHEDWLEDLDDGQ